MEFFKVVRTVSFYNDECEDILSEFIAEYSDNKTLVEATVIEENHISGTITEYIVGENKEEVFNFVACSEEVVGECYSVYDLAGNLIGTEDTELF